ncbi:NAD(P)-dependent oxidoreductase, partial [bacterium DOLZORAL124_64_63]
ERAAAVYRDFLPLKAEDIAETILFCATRPPHVNIQEVLIMPQDQAAAQAIHRRGVPDI